MNHTDSVRNHQVLLKIFHEFVAYVERNKLKIIRKHKKKYVVAFAVMTGFYASVALIYLYKSMVYSKAFTYDFYPQLLSSSSFKAILYIHQVVVIFYAPVILSTDSIIIMLITSATMRLELLKKDFTSIKRHSDLANCVYKHQQIIR